MKENGKENGEKTGFSSLNGIDRSKRIPRYYYLWFSCCALANIRIFAENIVHQILISSKEDLVDNNGFQPHVSWYVLPTLCNTSTVFYFCASISLVEITTGFHGWPICFSYLIQDKYSVEIWDQNTSFCIILSRFSYTVLIVLLFQGCFQPCGEEHVRVLLLTQ